MKKALPRVLFVYEIIENAQSESKKSFAKA